MGDSIYQQVGASDAAIGVSGSTGASVAREGSIALAQGATLKAGTDILGNTGTVNIGEAGLGQKFADTVRDLTNTFTSAQTASRIPNASTDLPDVAAAPGETPPLDNKKIWLGVAVLTVILVLFNRK